MGLQRQRDGGHLIRDFYLKLENISNSSDDLERRLEARVVYVDISSVRFYLGLFMLSETLAASVSLPCPEAVVGLCSPRPPSWYESSEATGGR